MAGFDSLYTGITGLNSYQSWIDMISNNIANVDTTGFKGQRMTFADLFYQNQTNASAPTGTNGGIDGQQLGFGVKVNTVDTEWQQGGLMTTGNPADLAINGDGFFIENNLTGTATPTYTRDGAFNLNENGVLVDPASGLAVQGWQANANGTVTPSGNTGNITIPLGLTEQATATGAGAKVGPSTADSVFDVAMGGNLDQTQWQQAFLNTIGASATTGGAFTVSTTMYDSLGNAHEATVTYTPDTVNATAATQTAFAADAFATSAVVSPTATQNATITINSNGPGNGYTLTDGALGNSVNVAAGQSGVIDGVTIATVGPSGSEPAAGADGQTITVTAATNGLPASVVNAAGVASTPATRWSVSVAFTDGTTFQTITKGGIASSTGAVTTQPQFGTGSSGVVGYAYFDENGQFINTSDIESGSTGAAAAFAINANTKNPAGLADFHTTGTAANLIQGNQLNVTLWGASAGNKAAPAAPGAIALGFWQNASLAGAYTANAISQNGFQAGTLDNFTIAADGTVTGAFTNGQNKVLAQVALARFQNEQGLSRVGSNMFEETANSGLAQVGAANSGVYGGIQSGALEQSNVSLATEFTNLIVAQRAFEANTRGITTADQNLETVINLRASEN
jgi:flagellar hook protein FlgE